LPKSWLIFFVALFASVSISIITADIVSAGIDPMHDVTLLLAVINAAFYFLVIQVAGYPRRYLQSLTAILGVDAIITLVYLVGFVTIGLFADEATILSFVWLITAWSVAVEGHIIARAIERPWTIGIAIAVVSYLLLLTTYWQLAMLP